MKDFNDMNFEEQLDYMIDFDKKHNIKYASYSICDDNEDEDNSKLIHPNETYLIGKCFVYEKEDGYCSRMLINPTYLDILKITDEYIKHTGDYHHIFLEGIQVVKQTDVDTYQISLCLGS